LSTIKRTGNRTRFKIVVRKNSRNLVLLGLIIIIATIFSLLNPIFLTLQSFMNMVNAIAVVSIAAIGMSLAILTGGIDLSVGSNLGLSATCAALVVTTTGNPFLGFLTAIIVASVIGLFNGLMAGKLKVSIIVLTLGMLGIARSLSRVLSNSFAIKVKNDVFNWLGGGYIKTSTARIPISLFIIILIFLLFYFLLNNTIFGRKLTAIGANVSASKVAGLSVDRNIVIIYLLIGVLIGIASIIDVGRISSATPQSGVGLEFDAITAVVLGGASLRGGKLDIKGTFLGVLLVGIVINGLALLNVFVYSVLVIKGGLLFLAVLTNNIVEKFQPDY
jgi:ribose transport system permease protein